MSILINGMEMPTSCYGCPFFKQVNYWNKNDEADILSKCKRTGEFTWVSVNGYLPNCPLVPVPPHGRLGDLDKLEQVFVDIDNAPYSGFDGTEPFYSAEDAAQIIRLAPTIIPEEEKKV